MNEGRLAAGETLEKPTGFLIAGAANPLVDTVEKLEQKLDAGVGVFQTNIVYDVERFAAWFAPMVEVGVDIIRALRDVPGVSGVHIMAPGWETEAVPRVVKGAALDTATTG